ncbi:tetratricopeptide repeat protein [Marinobacter nanhaiticus D15-8W]|uniref:Outer membrane protein assembly factor BamD n=1 Tax=Marinobacter nanhaiticus D15-8W TaxID=626887 RepID=N6W2D9_9GAMM|nr:tetratricopeptide repeat protein [Marinobacter nanhaiticus]ENO14264.1 hypothetical protein J057_22760 [Marinobacter nanhaiticus D15-8W]BES71651.1 tetratricopeptide repeat protein [Marinobacter nanhaiticus D15-8W]
MRMLRSQVSAIFFVGLLAASAWAETPASFQVNLGEDGTTIGEMRPVFLEMSSRPLPAISTKEVARRYQRLFEEAEEPEVRIDALHRLTNLHSLSGDGLDLSPEQEEIIYKEALKSYEMIVSQGRYQGRLDELLYQTAKAYAFIGNETQSITRLKQLVGLYPQSDLAPEARFRIAESAFSRGAYTEAEIAYQQVIQHAKRADLKHKALYMQGWSQYKQHKLGMASTTFFEVLDDYYARSEGFTALEGGSEDLVNDTFRILALMASRQGGARTLDQMLAEQGVRPYDYLLYDRLGDYYLAKRRYADSVAVNQHFVDERPAHPRNAALRAQIVTIWEAGGFEQQAQKAREAFVTAYAAPNAYAALSAPEQALWQQLARYVADVVYREAGQASPMTAEQGFSQAAGYYGRLGNLEMDQAESSEAGKLWRLAGDAWLQAGDQQQAQSYFTRAAYHAEGYGEAADAAWAALLIERKSPSPAGDEALIRSVDRFGETFPNDARAPSAHADLANRLLAAGKPVEAGREAILAVEHPRATEPQRRAAFLVLGQSAYEREDYVAAEKHYREALAIAEPEAASGNSTDPAIRDQLARTIYRQAETEDAEGDVTRAVEHFRRIAEVGADRSITVNAHYDAATALLRAEKWQPAIEQLQAFREDYPREPLTSTISEKLVLAYREAGEPVLAAEELLEHAGQRSSPWDARLRASEFLVEAGETRRANMIVGDYLAQVGAPGDADEHLSHQTLRHQVIASSPDDTALAMRTALVERELDSQWHSDETLAWAAQSALVLAEAASARFDAIALSLPLRQSLMRKRRALQTAVDRYNQAESMGDAEARSHALYGKAELFRTLARDIMQSDRPAGLNDLEQAQYAILLEEQAYPFEEKAIDMHAVNHEQVGEGIYNPWVERSLAALAEMFPGRYSRKTRWLEWTPEEVDYARAETR